MSQETTIIRHTTSTTHGTRRQPHSTRRQPHSTPGEHTTTTTYLFGDEGREEAVDELEERLRQVAVHRRHDLLHVVPQEVDRRLQQPTRRHVTMSEANTRLLDTHLSHDGHAECVTTTRLPRGNRRVPHDSSLTSRKSSSASRQLAYLEEVVECVTTARLP